MENTIATSDQAIARTTLKAEFDYTTGELLNTLSAFNAQQINAAIQEGCWTAGQNAEHVFKSAAGLIPVLCGATKPAERDPAEKVRMIKDLFLDFSAKFKSAPELLPSNGPHSKPEVIAAWEAVVPQVNELINNHDLFVICTDLVVPFFGELTRLEWLYLICYHTQKHIHQLKNIMQAL